MRAGDHVKAGCFRAKTIMLACARAAAGLVERDVRMWLPTEAGCIGVYRAQGLLGSARGPLRGGSLVPPYPTLKLFGFL